MRTADWIPTKLGHMVGGMVLHQISTADSLTPRGSKSAEGQYIGHGIFQALLQLEPSNLASTLIM